MPAILTWWNIRFRIRASNAFDGDAQNLPAQSRLRHRL
jgi:hypothetical protein